jgi:hypothetical protein
MCSSQSPHRRCQYETACPGSRMSRIPQSGCSYRSCFITANCNGLAGMCNIYMNDLYKISLKQNLLLQWIIEDLNGQEERCTSKFYYFC